MADPLPATTTLDTVEIVRRRLANGRTIADADVHRLVAEIDRLRTEFADPQRRRAKNHPVDWPFAADDCGSADAGLVAAPLATSLRMYPERGQRVGMRSGMMDAATLCDMIAREIETAGRPSKARRQMVAVAKRCGDAIEAMRSEVEVPRD